MPTIFLVRHAQASFGAADYDQLSELGLRQAAVLGDALCLRRPRADRVVCGTLRRHHQTAEGCMARFEPAVPPARFETDAAWDEYDGNDVIAAFDPRYRDPMVALTDFAGEGDPRRAFQAMFVRAMARWAAGKNDGDYRESWTAFRARVAGAFERVRGGLGKSEGAIVFTSGGPIGAVCGALLSLPDADVLGLMARLANAAVTKIVCGSQGAHLSTMNEHAHFEGENAPLMTYR